MKLPFQAIFEIPGHFSKIINSFWKYSCFMKENRDFFVENTQRVKKNQCGPVCIFENTLLVNQRSGICMWLVVGMERARRGQKRHIYVLASSEQYTITNTQIQIHKTQKGHVSGQQSYICVLASYSSICNPKYLGHRCSCVL